MNFIAYTALGCAAMSFGVACGGSGSGSSPAGDGGYEGGADSADDSANGDSWEDGSQDASTGDGGEGADGAAGRADGGDTGGGGDAPLMQWVNALSGIDAVVIAQGGETMVPLLGYTHATPPLLMGGPGDITWMNPETGAELLSVVLPPAAAVGSLVVCGSLDAPYVVEVPAELTPPSMHTRLRVVHAAPSLGLLSASVRLGAELRALGEPAFGERTAFADIDPQAPWELWVAAPTSTLVVSLPPLQGGHVVDAAVVTDAEGELYVLLVQDDGRTYQVADVSRVTRWRVANLTPHPAIVDVDDEWTGGTVEAMQSSGIVELWPGTKHVSVANANGGEPAVVLEALPLAKHTQQTTVVYPADDGSWTSTTVPDFSGQQTGNGTTEIRLVHAAPGIGDVDVYRYQYSDNWDTHPVKSLYRAGLGLGDVTAVSHPKTGTYGFGIDEDEDGEPEHTFEMGYFPDYGMTLYLARDADGTLRMGQQSPADTGIWWQYPMEIQASVRVVNLTSIPNLEILVPTWWELSSPLLVQPLHREGGYAVREGEITVSAKQWQGDGAWSWTGEVEGEHVYSVVFWQDGAGAVKSTLVDETIGDAPLIQLVHAAPGVGVVSATWAAAGTAPKPLGAVALGGVSKAVHNASPYSTPGTLTLDTTGDGQTDLSFTFSEFGIKSATTAFLVEDATWPYLVVAHESSVLTVVYAEELQTRVRTIYLPQSSGAMSLRLDGEPWQNMVPKPGYGVDEAVWTWASPYTSMPAGPHAVTSPTLGGQVLLDADLEGGRRYSLLVYGSEGDLRVEVLDDATAAEAAGGHWWSVTHAIPGPAEAGVFAYPQGKGAELLAAELVFGETTEMAPLGGPVDAFGVDRDGDGTPDWKTAMGSKTGLTRLFLVGTQEKMYLLAVPDGGYAWLGGQGSVRK